MVAKINFTGDLSRVNEEERDFINKHLDRFSDKYQSTFNEMHIKIDLHMLKETSRGRAQFDCKIHIDSDHGRFNAENIDFGAEKTITGALHKIDRQIQKHK